MNQGTFSFLFLSIFAAALFVCRHLPPLIRPPLIAMWGPSINHHLHHLHRRHARARSPECHRHRGLRSTGKAQLRQHQLRQHLLRRRTPCRCARDRRGLHCVNPDVLFRLHHSSKLHCSPEIVCFGHNCLGCSWCSCHPSILAQTRDRLIDAPASNCRCCSR